MAIIQIAALIVENTFTSIKDVVLGWSLFGLQYFLSLFVRKQWNSASRIPLIPAALPILMLSGEDDEVVPQRHMRMLWDKVEQRHEVSKKLVKDRFHNFRYGRHSNTCEGPEYWGKVSSFLDSLDLENLILEWPPFNCLLIFSRFPSSQLYARFCFRNLLACITTYEIFTSIHVDYANCMKIFIGELSLPCLEQPWRQVECILWSWAWAATFY